MIATAYVKAATVAVRRCINESANKPGAGWSDTKWIERRTGCDGGVWNLSRVHSQSSPAFPCEQKHHIAARLYSPYRPYF